jgi:hypothetical protein
MAKSKKSPTVPTPEEPIFPPGPPRQVEPITPDTVGWGHRRRAEDHADPRLRERRLMSLIAGRNQLRGEVARGGLHAAAELAKVECAIAELEAE